MAKSVIMPALGMAQESGVLVKWLVAEGGPVVEGEPLMEVETDKAIVEVAANASGTLAAVAHQEGAEVKIGTVLAVILEPGEEAAAAGGAGAAPAVPAAPTVHAAPAAPVAPAPPAVPAATIVPVGPVAPVVSGAAIARTAPLAPVAVAAPAPSDGVGRREPGEGRVLASPKAKRLAREHGVDLATFVGSGPGGAVRAVDIGRLVGGEPVGQPQPAAAVGHDGAPAPALPPRPVEAAPAAMTVAWCHAPFDAAPLWRFLDGVNSSARSARLGLAWPASVLPADFLTRALLGAISRAGTGGLADLASGGVAVRVFSPAGVGMRFDLTPLQARSILDVALEREAGQGEGAADRPTPVLVDDRSAQSFEQSSTQLPLGALLRLTLGPVRQLDAAAEPATGARRDAGLRLDYDSSRIGDADAAAVFSHLIRVLEDPFSLAVYG